VSVTAPELFPERPHHLVQKYGREVRAAAGIEPASIAASLGITERTVCMIQRKLGLRACRSARQGLE